jgi:hypothetical protein
MQAGALFLIPSDLAKGNFLSAGLNSIPVFGAALKAAKGAVAIERGAAVAAPARAGANAAASAATRAVVDILPQGCFAAGTPVLTPGGAKPIEQLQVGDFVQSRSESEVHGPIEFRRVEQTLAQLAAVVELRVGGRTIRTTSEHPFYVRGSAWTPARQIRAGDLLSTHDGAWARAEGVVDTGEVTTVYNVAIAGARTYFVGSPAWGFAVWAHNSDICWRVVKEAIERELGRATELGQTHLGGIAEGINFGTAEGRAAAERLLTRPGSGVSAVQARAIVESLAARRIVAAPTSWGGVVANTVEEAAFLRNVGATFPHGSVFSSAKRFQGAIVIQRSDIPFSVQNVRRMASGNAPFVRNSAGQWERVNLHHVGRQDGRLIEVLASQNAYNSTTGGPLHIPGPGGPLRDATSTPSYWRQRLQDAIGAGAIPQNVLRDAGL